MNMQKYRPVRALRRSINMKRAREILIEHGVVRSGRAVTLSVVANLFGTLPRHTILSIAKQET